MFKNITVEAENNELILKNKKGDYVIIPANKRNWVKLKLKQKCHTCIDSLVESLPVASQYAEYGSVYSDDDFDPRDLLLSKKKAKKQIKDAVEFKTDEELQEFFKAKKKLGHRISYADATRYIDLNKLEGKDLYEFVSNNVKQGFKMSNSKEWVKEVPNKGYVPPITEAQILNYRKFQETSGKLKTDPTFAELKTFLEKNGYSPNALGLKSGEMTGKNMLDMAKRKGVPLTKNEDGTYSMMDDENTFLDTNQSFAKQRIIHPDATYMSTPYVKGNDIVNYYNMTVEPKYAERIPTPQEEKDYAEGRYFTEGMTPEFNTVYLDSYFDPKTANSEQSLTMKANNEEMAQRYKKVKEIADNIQKYKNSEEYKKDKEWQATKAKLNPANLTKGLMTGKELMEGLKYGNSITH